MGSGAGNTKYGNILMNCLINIMLNILYELEQLDHILKNGVFMIRCLLMNVIVSQRCILLNHWKRLISKPSLQLNKAILETAKKMGRKLTVAKAASSDVYTREEKAKVLVNDAIQKEKVNVEMESYALF